MFHVLPVTNRVGTCVSALHVSHVRTGIQEPRAGELPSGEVQKLWAWPVREPTDKDRKPLACVKTPVPGILTPHRAAQPGLSG